MTKVIVRNGNLEGALKNFKAKSSASREEVKKHEVFLKRGVRNRMAKEKGIKNTRRREKKNRD